MIFEHFAINVEKPFEVRDWYCQNLGLKVVRAMDDPPFMMFLADSSGRVVVEFYHRSDAPITDFRKEHHLTFHVAFISENAEEDKIRLMNAGATLIEEVRPEEGSHLIMLRDPWGIPLQLCQRKNKL